MQAYQKIIVSYVSASATRMLIGASSTIYMLVSGINLYEVGLIKSIQAILIFVLGFAIGILSDRIERKWLHLTALVFSTLWLYFFYLAGMSQSFELFLFAEILNAVSLCIYQNNTNAYLVDQFYQDQPKHELNLAFGQLGKWEFLTVAFTSLLGGVLYHFFSSNLFLFTAVMMSLILFASSLLLPRVARSRNTVLKPKSLLDKTDFLLLARKFWRYRQALCIFLILSLYFQIIIQYWQAIVYAFEHTQQQAFLLGGILFLMFMMQSFAGLAVERKWQLHRFIAALLFFVSMLLAQLAENSHSVLLYTVSLCLGLFVVRYMIIQTDVLLHRQLLSRFRAKYDMLLNSVLRILTALALLIIGALSHSFGIQIIHWTGFIIAGLFLLSECLSIRLRNRG